MPEVNLVSILLGALASFFVGMLWYGPLFGKQWMKMMGFTMDNIKKMKMKPLVAMALGFVSLLVMGYVVTIFTNVFAAVGYQGALQLTFFLWLGFIAPTLLGSVLWENKSPKLFFFNIAYQFVALLAMTSVIVLLK